MIYTGAREAIAPQDCVGDDAHAHAPGLCLYRPMDRRAVCFSRRSGKALRYSEEDIFNGTTIALSSQDLCGFRVDEKAIRALMAAKLPDLSSDLITLQLLGYARVRPRLDDEQRKRHCVETRALAEAVPQPRSVEGWR